MVKMEKHAIDQSLGMAACIDSSPLYSFFLRKDRTKVCLPDVFEIGYIETIRNSKQFRDRPLDL
jgi:hypothetical protein